MSIMNFQRKRSAMLQLVKKLTVKNEPQQKEKKKVIKLLSYRRVHHKTKRTFWLYSTRARQWLRNWKRLKRKLFNSYVEKLSKSQIQCPLSKNRATKINLRIHKSPKIQSIRSRQTHLRNFNPQQIKYFSSSRVNSSMVVTPLFGMVQITKVSQTYRIKISELWIRVSYSVVVVNLTIVQISRRICLHLVNLISNLHRLARRFSILELFMVKQTGLNV